MRRDWRAVRVHPQASVLQTMAVVSDGRLGIAVVVDENDRLLGTVTDGDVRRAILAETGLDTLASSLMERNFTSVGPDVGWQQVRRLMRDRSIHQVPVCENGRVVGLYVLQDLDDFEVRPNWVVIFAGGEGKRLWPLTSYIPKPMLPVGGRPMLDLVLAHIVRFGFRRVFLAINYLGEQIEGYFGDGRRHGCTIEYLREDEPLGTGGALKLLPNTPDEPILVTNADLLTDVDVGEFMDFHQSHDAAASMCVRELTYQMPYGVVSCEGDNVISVEEKPLQRQVVNAGIYCLDPTLLSYVPDAKTIYGLPTLIDEAISQGLGVKAYPIKDAWMDVGLLGDYEKASRAGAEGSEHKS